MREIYSGKCLDFKKERSQSNLLSYQKNKSKPNARKVEINKMNIEKQEKINENKN